MTALHVVTVNSDDDACNGNAKRFCAALTWMMDGDEPLIFARLQKNGMSAEDLLHLAHRVLAGRVQYGKLNLETDRRDWAYEAKCEELDRVWYEACAAEMRQ